MPSEGEPVIDKGMMEEGKEYFVKDDGEGENEDNDEDVLDLD